jgi:hypothetical protein
LIPSETKKRNLKLGVPSFLPSFLPSLIEVQKRKEGTPKKEGRKELKKGRKEGTPKKEGRKEGSLIHEKELIQ